MKNVFAFILLFLCLNLQGQERYVSINGQKFRIKEFGVGGKTVIFESGQSDSLEAWGSIPDTVASFAHVFLKDFYCLTQPRKHIMKACQKKIKKNLLKWVMN